MNKEAETISEILKSNPSLSIGNGGEKMIQWDEEGMVFVLFRSNDEIQTVDCLSRAEIHWLSN